MSEKDWEKFFELIDKIVEQGNPFEEKKQDVLMKNKEYGNLNFEEFVSWFSEGDFQQFAK